MKPYSDYSHFADMENLKDMFWLEGGLDGGGESAAFKIAEKEVDLEQSGLITIALSDDMDVSELTLENGRIDFQDGAITAQNFVIDMRGFDLEGDDQLRESVSGIETTASALCSVDPYWTFTIEFDENGDGEADFTLVLENFVSDDVYTRMEGWISNNDGSLEEILINEYYSDAGGLFLV